MEWIDISMPIEEGMPVYSGDPPFQKELLSDHAQGDAWQISQVHMTMHAGTHIDFPAHCYADGKQIEAFSLSHFCGWAHVVEVPAKGATMDVFQQLPLLPQEHVLFKVLQPKDAIIREEEWLSEEIVDYLIQCSIGMVGINRLSIDADDSNQFPYHHLFLQHNICILEGLMLDHVVPGRYYLACFPLRFSRVEASPVRAVLREKPFVIV